MTDTFQPGAWPEKEIQEAEELFLNYDEASLEQGAIGVLYKLVEYLKTLPKPHTRLGEATPQKQEAETLLRNLVEKLIVVQPEIDGMFAFAFNHGINYSGPTYKVEMKAAKEFLGIPKPADIK